MAKWIEVAEGTNIQNLTATIADMELPKGSKVKVIMDLKIPVGGMFNWAAADWLAERFVPDGLDFIDAYGKGSQGIIEFEADPAWLLAVLAFMKAHWLALTIGIFTLALIVAYIIVLVKIAVAPPLPIAAIAIGGGLILIGILAVATAKKRR